MKYPNPMCVGCSQPYASRPNSQDWRQPIKVLVRIDIKNHVIPRLYAAESMVFCTRHGLTVRNHGEPWSVIRLHTVPAWRQILNPTHTLQDMIIAHVGWGFSYGGIAMGICVVLWLFFCSGRLFCSRRSWRRSGDRRPYCKFTIVFGILFHHSPKEALLGFRLLGVLELRRVEISLGVVEIVRFFTWEEQSRINTPREFIESGAFRDPNSIRTSPTRPLRQAHFPIETVPSLLHLPPRAYSKRTICPCRISRSPQHTSNSQQSLTTWQQPKTKKNSRLHSPKNREKNNKGHPKF